MLSLAHVPGPCLAEPLDEMMRAPAQPALNYTRLQCRKLAPICGTHLSCLQRGRFRTREREGLAVSMKGFLFILTITPGLTLAGCLSAYGSQ